jgi:hypothetical protein
MSGYPEWTVTVVSDDGEWMSEGVVSAGLGGLMLLVSSGATWVERTYASIRASSSWMDGRLPRRLDRTATQQLIDQHTVNRII